MKVNLIQLPAANGRLPQPITVAAGQVIRVQVVKAEGSQVWLQLGGHVIRADSRLQFSPGDRLQVQVLNVKPDLIEMRLLYQAPPPGKAPSLAAGLGLPHNPVSQQMVAQMMRFGLPMPPAALTELYTFIKGRRMEGDMIQMLVWLKSIGVKAADGQDVKALAALQQFFRGDMAENEELRFFQFLNQTAAEAMGNYSIQGWPLPGGHVYLISRGLKRPGHGTDERRVLLRVRSAVLQELWVQLELAGERLNIEVSCMSSQADKILQRQQEKLEQALQAVGYQTGIFRIRVLDRPATILDFVPEPPINTWPIDLQA